MRLSSWWWRSDVAGEALNVGRQRHQLAIRAAGLVQIEQAPGKALRVRLVLKS